MEPLKNLLGAALIEAAAARLQATWAAFDCHAFTRLASEGLDALEMKARAMQIASALEATLPADSSAARDVIERALAPGLEPGEVARARRARPARLDRLAAR